MKLYYSSTSPFVRKCLVAAHELGLAEQSPALPHWLSAWSQSCDDMSLHLRGEEAS